MSSPRARNLGEHFVDPSSGKRRPRILDRYGGGDEDFVLVGEG
jgi:hypothetical protein